MGANDAKEQLEVAIQECIRLERLVTELRAQLASVSPRVVSTVEELDALPEGSVVLNRARRAYSHMNCWGELAWFAGGSEVEAASLHTLPATVLFTPDEGNKQ